MNEKDSGLFGMSLQNVSQVHDLIGRLFRVAEPGAVYSEPIVAGDRTVVVTSELSMSVGAGVGFGHSDGPAEQAASQGNAPDGSGSTASSKDETGGGGGGGGFSFGRPVAAVIIEPTGVRVEPIVDPTKLGIAFFTTVGAMFFAWTQLRRTTQQLAARQYATDKRTAARLEHAMHKETKQAAKRAAKDAKRTAKETARAARQAGKEAAKEAKRAGWEKAVLP
jgi:uncharacterized spore protein YtfJ